MGSHRVAGGRRSRYVDDHLQEHSQLSRVVHEHHDARRSLRGNSSKCVRLRSDVREVLHCRQFGANEWNSLRFSISNWHHRLRPGPPSNYACYQLFCLSRYTTFSCQKFPKERWKLKVKKQSGGGVYNSGHWPQWVFGGGVGEVLLPICVIAGCCFKPHIKNNIKITLFRLRFSKFSKNLFFHFIQHKLMVYIALFSCLKMSCSFH